MKKIIYILCSLLSIYITIDMGYSTWEQVTSEPFTFRMFMRILAVIGWGCITYDIITRRYKWVQKLFK